MQVLGGGSPKGFSRPGGSQALSTRGERDPFRRNGGAVLTLLLPHYMHRAKTNLIGGIRRGATQSRRTSQEPHMRHLAAANGTGRSNTYVTLALIWASVRSNMRSSGDFPPTTAHRSGRRTSEAPIFPFAVSVRQPRYARVVHADPVMAIWSLIG